MCFQEVGRRCGSFATPLPLGWTRGRVCGFISRAVTRSVMRGNRADLRVALPLAAGRGARPVATRVFAWCFLNSMKLSWQESTTPHPRNRKSWFWQAKWTTPTRSHSGQLQRSYRWSSTLLTRSKKEGTTKRMYVYGLRAFGANFKPV